MGLFLKTTIWINYQLTKIMIIVTKNKILGLVVKMVGEKEKIKNFDMFTALRIQGSV